MSAVITTRGVARVARGGPPPLSPRAQAASIGLWVFMGVATSLFSLFAWAYVMRMSGPDAVTLALPRQLWLSTALLVAGSVALLLAVGAARDSATAPRARQLLLAGGLCALAFLAAQLWAWGAMQAAQVLPTTHPAGSFFYLLTAMHGLHLIGGLVGWAWAARSAWPLPMTGAWRIALCARYWHFMLAVWLALYAMLRWLTPEAARFICGTAA